MSNKTPIQSTPCSVCHGWLRCKIKAMTCWAQDKIEFLCERKKRGEMKKSEFLIADHAFERFHLAMAGQVISEGAAKITYTLEGYREWLECAKASGFEPTQTEEQLSWGRLTLANKIGMLPTTGLTCMCCAGYRVWFALVLGVVLGYAL
jgi:hypothetical protein